MEIGDDFAPENAALHDVGFFNRMNFMPPLAGQFEPDRSDAANLVFVIGLRIKSAARFLFAMVSTPRGSPK